MAEPTLPLDPVTADPYTEPELYAEQSERAAAAAERFRLAGERRLRELDDGDNLT